MNPTNIQKYGLAIFARQNFNCQDEDSIEAIRYICSLLGIQYNRDILVDWISIYEKEFSQKKILNFLEEKVRKWIQENKGRFIRRLRDQSHEYYEINLAQEAAKAFRLYEDDECEKHNIAPEWVHDIVAEICGEKQIDS